MSFTTVNTKNASPRKRRPPETFNPPKERTNTNISAAGPYSHAIKTPTAIYCSGQIPSDVEGNLVTGTIQELTRQCIQNLKAVLEEAGSGIEKVVKVNVFITDMANFAVCFFFPFSGCQGKQDVLMRWTYKTEHERGVLEVVHPQAGPELRGCQAAAQERRRRD
jgi:enamine deaminase RidA (YjgF/YER057c/UK114 family)